MNINQIKLEVHDTYREDEKITTNFQPNNNEGAIKKAHLGEKIRKIKTVIYNY